MLLYLAAKHKEEEVVADHLQAPVQAQDPDQASHHQEVHHSVPEDQVDTIQNKKLQMILFGISS